MASKTLPKTKKNRIENDDKKKCEKKRLSDPVGKPVLASEREARIFKDIAAQDKTRQGEGRQRKARESEGMPRKPFRRCCRTCREAKQEKASGNKEMQENGRKAKGKAEKAIDSKSGRTHFAKKSKSSQKQPATSSLKQQKTGTDCKT